MADNIRAKCRVVVVEECDEGFSHIESGIGKILGGECNYTITGNYRYFYDATIDVTTSSADLITIGAECIDGTVLEGTDEIDFLYIKNLHSTHVIFINLSAGAQADVDGDIEINAGDALYLKLHNANVADVHAKGSTTGMECEVFAAIDTAPGA